MNGFRLAGIKKETNHARGMDKAQVIAKNWGYSKLLAENLRN